MEGAGTDTDDGQGSPVDPLQLFASYPFSTDSTYQQGIQSIVASGALDGQPQDDRENVLLQSQIFYFNRITGHSLSIDAVRRSRPVRDSSVPAVSRTTPTTSTSPPALHATDEGGEPRTLSFAELKELIEQGKTDQIPNNRTIPNELNQKTPSESQATARKKPWELVEL
ncbi:hypothetical protein B0H21DRAFT_824361 [Amylocystis lapponica]|nr:hypothetical protein B0H21DRAFT_824361 [Amylocystis lapponica]